jgi:diguanylate cyclase (GGDEF)-like protein/PAS domain S-box-containing protein
VPPDLLAAIHDPARLAALRRLNLLDSPAEPAFDRLTRLAAAVLHTPIALITLIDADRQFFKSYVGLPEPWAEQRETPLVYSFCRHMVASSEPLIIRDVRAHLLARDNPAIDALQSVAYAGIPLITTDGHAIGSLCVVDTMPREWREDEIAILSDLAASVMSEIQLRSDAAARRQAEEALHASEHRLSLIYNGVSDLVFLMSVEAEHQYRCLTANAAYLAHTGLSAEQVIGRRLDQIVPEAELPLALEKYNEAIRNTTPISYEGYYDRPVGQIFFETTLTPIFDEQGTCTHLLGVVHDITERKRAEEALDIRARQQAAIADLGQRALTGADLTGLFNDAVGLVAGTLDVEFCEALELMPDGTALRLRAGAGWREGLVGWATVGAGKDSYAGYTLFSNQPVVVDDLRTETRFRGPELLRDHGVVNGITVIIRGQQRPFGVLGAHTTRPRTFTNDDVHFLQAVANVLGTAISRKLAEQAIAFQAHLLNVVEQAVIATDMRGMIIYWNRFAEILYGWSAEEAKGRDMLDLLSDESTRSEAARIISRLQGGERWAGDFLIRRRDGTTFPAHMVDSPVRDEHGALIGVVGVAVDMTEHKRIEEIQREARDQLEIQVAGRTTELREVNQQLARWVSELEQRNSEVLLLSEMGELLQTCLTVEEAYAVLARALPQLFAAETGALYVRPERQGFVVIAEWGAPGPRTFTVDDCWALRRGRTHLVAGPGGGPVCGHIGVQAFTGSICVPVVAQSELLGLLHVRTAAPDPFSLVVDTERGVGGLNESRRRLAATVAEHVALALSNLMLRETLRQQAIRDPLTNLFNRRYMEESLDRELSRASRRESPLGVIMLDIDYFKPINDTFGHAAGDTLLRAIGALLLAHTRAEDIACRYGGEEFTLILPDSPLEDTWRRAEQLRAAVKRLRVRHGGDSLAAVTISAGVASYPEHGSVPEALLRAADLALYQAKAEGRDRVVKQMTDGRGVKRESQ